MKTLKDLLEEYKYFGVPDLEIIKNYFVLNNLEEEAIDMMNYLAKTKMEKLRMKNSMAEDWIYRLPSKYLYEHYELDVADRLHRIELDYLIHGGSLTDSNLKWAKENVPNIKEPEWYFRPLIEWMESQGIKFKE